MANVQRDWEHRHFVETQQYNVMKVTNFLNEFETSTRYRLAKINEKLTYLERSMDFMEGSIKTIQSGQQK